MSYSPWGHKELDTSEQLTHTHKLCIGFPGGSDSKESACNAGDLGLIPGQEDPLEKEMATHFSILAWKISWTEEPSRAQAMGLRS